MFCHLCTYFMKTPYKVTRDRERARKKPGCAFVLPIGSTETKGTFMVFWWWIEPDLKKKEKVADETRCNKSTVKAFFCFRRDAFRPIHDADHLQKSHDLLSRAGAVRDQVQAPLHSGLIAHKDWNKVAKVLIAVGKRWLTTTTPPL